MVKNIEVECRGPLTFQQYKILMQFFHTHGRFQERSKRISFIYFRRRVPKNVIQDKYEKVDLRVRVTNKQLEAVIKYGQWAGSDTRKEISLFFPENKFEDLVSFLAILGWYSCVASTTKKHVFHYKHIEFSLVNVERIGYNFEAEIVAHPHEIQKKKTYILSILRELQLKPFTHQQFLYQCNKVNNSKNLQFNFQKQSPSLLRRRFPSYF